MLSDSGLHAYPLKSPNPERYRASVCMSWGSLWWKRLKGTRTVTFTDQHSCLRCTFRNMWPSPVFVHSASLSHKMRIMLDYVDAHYATSSPVTGRTRSTVAWAAVCSANDTSVRPLTNQDGWEFITFVSIWWWNVFFGWWVCACVLHYLQRFHALSLSLSRLPTAGVHDALAVEEKENQCVCVCALLTELRDLIDTHRENYASFQMLSLSLSLSVCECVCNVFVRLSVPIRESGAHLNRVSTVHGVCIFSPCFIEDITVSPPHPVFPPLPTRLVFTFSRAHPSWRSSSRRAYATKIIALRPFFGYLPLSCYTSVSLRLGASQRRQEQINVRHFAFIHQLKTRWRDSVEPQHPDAEHLVDEATGTSSQESVVAQKQSGNIEYFTFNLSKVKQTFKSQVSSLFLLSDTQNDTGSDWALKFLGQGTTQQLP